MSAHNPLSFLTSISLAFVATRYRSASAAPIWQLVLQATLNPGDIAPLNYN